MTFECADKMKDNGHQITVTRWLATPQANITSRKIVKDVTAPQIETT